MIGKKITNFAFVGLLSLNLFRPYGVMEKTATPTGEKRQRLEEKIESKIEHFKETRGQLKNVKVTAVGSASITVDNAGSSVTVNITDKTEFRRKFWGKSSISEISVGDTVNVIGKWTDDTKAAINAVVIRDESIQKRFGVFFGTVKSLTSDGFVLTTVHRDDETVTIGTAKINDRKGSALTSADIKVGDKIRVRGMWNNTAKTITETVEIKNFSLPPFASHEPSPSTTP